MAHAGPKANSQQNRK